MSDARRAEFARGVSQAREAISQIAAHSRELETRCIRSRELIDASREALAAVSELLRRRGPPQI